jgi:flagellar hook-length control protein FliK
MIPLSGLMQAFTGSSSVFGDKSASHGNLVPGQKETDGANLPFDKAAGSFLEWVQKMMDSDAPLEIDGKGILNLKDMDSVSDLPFLYQLRTLVTDAMGQRLVNQNHPQILNADIPGDAQEIAIPRILDTLIARREGQQPGDTPIEPNDSQALNTDNLSDGQRAVGREVSNAKVVPEKVTQLVDTAVRQNDSQTLTGPVDGEQATASRDVSNAKVVPGKGTQLVDTSVRQNDSQTRIGAADEGQATASRDVSNAKVVPEKVTQLVDTSIKQNASQNLNTNNFEEGKNAEFPIKLNAFPAQNEDKQAGDKLTRQAVSVPQSSTAPKENQPNAGLFRSTDEESPRQDGNNPEKEKPFSLKAKSDTPIQETGPQTLASGSKPSRPAGGDEKLSPNPIAQPRLPSESGIFERAIDPIFSHQNANSGTVKNPEFWATVSTDRETTSSEQDTANSQNKVKGGQTQRVVMAETNQDEFLKDQSSDPTKSTSTEFTKLHSSFQDTAKAIATEPSINVTDKPTAFHATQSSQPESPMARTFQTTVMDQIVDKAAIRSIHGRSEIQIRLKPEFLGNVQMNIATDKEQVVVRILTDVPAVKEIIETHLHHLKTELQHHGLTIDKFEVMVNPDADQQHSREQFSQMFKNNSFQNGRRQAHGKNPETEDRDGGNHKADDQPNRDGVNYFA